MKKINSDQEYTRMDVNVLTPEGVEEYARAGPVGLRHLELRTGTADDPDALAPLLARALALREAAIETVSVSMTHLSEGALTQILYACGPHVRLIDFDLMPSLVTKAPRDDDGRTIGVQLVRCLAAMPRLTGVSFSTPMLNMRALVGRIATWVSEDPPALNTLAFEMCGLGDTVVELSHALAYNHHLKTLAITRDDVGTEAAAFLGVAIAGHPSLTLLDLSDTRVPPRGAEMLLASPITTKTTTRVSHRGRKNAYFYPAPASDSDAPGFVPITSPTS